MGDSKTTDNPTWSGAFVAEMNSSGITAQLAPVNFGMGGFDTTMAQAQIDAWLIANPYTGLNWVLYDLGVNDKFILDPTAYESKTAYVLDAIHTTYPNLKIIIAKSWWATYQGGTYSPAQYATAIDNIVSTRTSWLRVWDNELVVLGNGDDGATRTIDGIHENALGAQAMATAARISMGY